MNAKKFNILTKALQSIDIVNRQLRDFYLIHRNFRKQLNILNNVSNELCKVIDIGIILQQFEKENLNDINKAINLIEQQFDHLNQDKRIYNFLLSLKYDEKWQLLTSQDMEFVNTLMFDYEEKYFINNVTKQAQMRQLIQIEEHLKSNLLANIRMGRQLVSIKIDDLNSLTLAPDFYSRHIVEYNKESNSAMFALNTSNLLTLLKYCKDKQIRDVLFKNFLISNKENLTVLQQLQTIRQEIAKLCGHKSYISYSLQHNGRSCLEVAPQLEYLLQERLKSVQQDIISILKHHKIIQQLKQYNIEDQNGNISFQDLIYLRSRISEQINIKFGSQQHLQIDQVFQIINILAKQQYGLQIKFTAQDSNNQINESLFQSSFLTSLPSHQILTVQCYEGENGKLVGIIFLNIFQGSSRSNVSTQIRIIQGHCRNQLLVQIPWLYIKAGYYGTESAQEIWFSFDQVKGLVHEFGHALTIISQKHDYQLIANNEEIILAEIKAIQFENSLINIEKYLDEGSLKQLGLLFLKNEEWILFNKLFSNIDQLEQIYYSLLDLSFHDRSQQKFEDFQQNNITILRRVFTTPFIDPMHISLNNWYCNIEHLAIYPGLYFVYAIGDILSSQINKNKNNKFNML